MKSFDECWDRLVQQVEKARKVNLSTYLGHRGKQKVKKTRYSLKLYSKLLSVVEANNIRIVDEPSDWLQAIILGMEAQFNETRKTIWLCNMNGSYYTVSLLAHEMAHALGATCSYKEKEEKEPFLEAVAESVAYIVCSMNKINILPTASLYVKGYLKRTNVTLDEVRPMVEAIVNKFELNT